MSDRRSRHSVLVALALVLATSGPAAATDPEPSDSATPSGSSPTVHAEMLAAHATDESTFEPGPAPAPLTTGPSVQAEGGSGGIAGLPNGLRREVFGYLPYWEVSGPDLGQLNYGLVSSIAYFSVGARANGTLAKTSGGEPTVGWAGWNSSAMSTVISKAHERGVKVVLTVTMMAWDYDFSDFATLLKSSTNRGKLAAEIAAAVKSRNADGVNLDFEPMPNSLESYYTLFVRKVKSELLRTGAGSYLTVAATGGAASWDEGYELVDNDDANTYSLTSSGGADAIMAMAYDFNWSGSSRAGGVAPMDSPYILDARTAMSDYLELLPGSKIIWGIPYYGRAWTTTGSSLNGRTCSSAGTCDPASWASGYAVAREAGLTHGRKWDDVGKVRWYTYVSSTYGTHVQGYYDDSASLNVKYDFVKANGVRGVGIWHLLMDAPRTELWDRLAVEFRDLPFTDIAGSAFVSEIVWLADEGITTGCTSTLFCPRDPVSRGQMASFLARALALPASSTDWFSDDDGLSHEDNINRLADAGITLGCTDTEFCPADPVSRGQMASFLARGLALPASSKDWFSDDDGLSHEDNINRLANAGITLGCTETRFCPSGIVIRQQMAAFLFRALGS